MVTKKAAEAVRVFTRAKSRFKTARIAWADVRKRSPIGKESAVTPDHTAGEFRFRVSPKSEVPKTSPTMGRDKAKARRPNTSAAKNISSTKNTSGSPVVAVVAIAAVGAGLFIAYRYRSQIRSKFLQARRSGVRRSRVPLKAAVTPVAVLRHGGERSPFRLPTGGGELFNADPGSFEFPEDITFETGDGFNIAIRRPFAETESIQHTAI